MAYFGRVILLIGNKAFVVIPLLLSCVVTAAETSNSSSNEKTDFVMININKICMIIPLTVCSESIEKINQQQKEDN